MACTEETEEKRTILTWEDAQKMWYRSSSWKYYFVIEKRTPNYKLELPLVHRIRCLSKQRVCRVKTFSEIKNKMWKLYFFIGKLKTILLFLFYLIVTFFNWSKIFKTENCDWFYLFSWFQLKKNPLIFIL